MNLSGRFFVKSNYIRAAKDDWILCDVRLLTDDTDTFLCIKSLPSSVLLSENNNYIENSVDKLPEKSPYRPENFATRPFTALCNLSEYKSCSMRTEAVNSSASFALKLVPSSVFGNKKLLIATEDENEITTWLAICKTCIGKKSKNCSSNNRDLACNLGTLSKSGSFMSLKPNSQACESEFDDGLMDNEVYEAYSSEDKIPALLEEAGDWMKLHLCQPDCYLRLTADRLEVLDFYSHKPVHWFPYLLIRRFGASNGVLRVDAGRRCSTGDGKFFFRCSPPNGQPVDALVTQIRQLALEAKQRTKRSQLTLSNLELHANNNTTTNNNNDSGTLPNNINHHNKVGESPVNTNDNLDNDQLDASIHGTLPRARSKRTKLPSESTVLRSSSNCINGGNRSSNNNGTNSQSECLPPKATPETSDDVDSQTIPANTNDTNEVFKATLCKASVPKNDQESVNTSSNLYDNLPRPPRRSSRLPGAINVLPLPARSHKQKDLHNSANIETPVNTSDTQFSTDTLDNLIRLNSKHIKAQSSLGSLTLSSTSPTSATTTTSPGVSPHTTSNESSSMLTPSTISSPSPSSSSSSPSVSLAFMSKKAVTPTCLSQPSLAPSNRLQLYSRNNENNNTAASSSLSSINFIDSSEIKSTDGCSSIQTSPSAIKTTMTTETPMTTTPILTTSSSSSNSVVKSLIQSYTSISSNNSKYNSNNNFFDDNLANKSRHSSLFVPVTTTTTTTTTISSSSSKSPASNSFSSAIKTTPTNDYNNDGESKIGIHNSTNKLSNLGGKMRVPSSMISQSDITDPQQQKQQLPSNFSHFTNSKSSSASLFLSGPHPTSKQQHTNVTSNPSSSSSCTLSTCSPTTNNNIVKPISLPVKRDSVFRAEKTIPRRSLEANNNATIHNNNNNNNESIQSPINTSILNSNNKIRVTKDDSRRYLSELDSVIKELCEANEAAVQATREAAQRRQYLGWSSTTNSQLKLTSTNESNIIPIPSSTNA
ncbi:unnamed protein product [Schistosoma rodhaini]|uniref:IRS-type PTB domain-containing protein n=1 Tax=Schistosoma rodhaini TaxID=6188 RepID=A0AA85G5I7_9TREM|nr:unnamed protein product [Schistosoma rodhaini]CAH8605926.1 unnamed protein product [Schistosoma rodhaini]